MQELLLSATFVGYTGCFYGIMVLKLTKLGFKSGYYPLRFHLMAGFLPVAFASSLFIVICRNKTRSQAMLNYVRFGEFNFYFNGKPLISKRVLV